MIRRIGTATAFVIALSAPSSNGDTPAFQRACADVETLLAGTPRATVARRDARFPNPRFGEREHQGCVVELRGTRTEDRLRINLFQWFEAHGWVGHPEYAADGTDGSDWAMFHRPDLTLCLVSESWHDQSDDEPAPPPPEDFSIDVACTHDSTLAGYVTPLEEMERAPRVIRHSAPPQGGNIRLPDGRILVPAGSVPPPELPH
jgi:hypothetical protein